MKRIITTVVLLTSLLGINAQEADANLISKGLSAYHTDFATGSARYTAMGGSMGALGGDVSAINTNPAASGVFIKSNITATLGLNNTENIGTLGNSNTTSNSLLNFNQVGGVINIKTQDDKWKMVNIGVLYDRKDINSDVNYGKNSNLTASDYYYDTDNNLVYDVNYKFNGYNSYLAGSNEKITLNVGTNYDNRIFLGGSINFHSTTFSNEEIYKAGYTDSNNLESTIIYQGNGSPYNETSSGVSFGVGAIAKISQNVRLGAAYQSKVNWNDVYNEHNAYYFLEDQTIDPVVDSEFYDQDKLNSASKLSLSGALVLGKNFSINADYITHFTKDLAFKAKDDFYDGTNNFIQEYAKNSSEIRVGAEYRYNKLRFRGGFSTADAPFKNVALSNYYDATGSIQNNEVTDLFGGKKQTYSAGLGYDFGSFFLDFAYQNATQEYKSLIGGTFVDPGYYPLNVPTTVTDIKNTQNNFILSCGWNF